MSYLLLCLLALSAVYAKAPLHLKVNSIPDSYIVVFKQTVGSDVLASDLAAIQLAHNISYEHTYGHALKGFAANLNKAQLMAIRSHPRVDYIEQNQVVRLSQNCFKSSGATWGISRITKRKLFVDGSFSINSKLGAGINAYIIDTGINMNHVDFENRATFGFNANAAWPKTDDQGHGTHVASTVGGKTWGVAKKVELIHVKVLDESGSGTMAGVIAGVDYATKQHNEKGKPSVANLSLGGGKSTALDEACNAASDDGVIMVVAAGNDNSDACNGSPSGASQVIGVGATQIAENADGTQYDRRSSFSNYGSCVSIFAPGTQITAAWIGSTTAINTISGTSMASPHVAGAVAVLLGETPGLDFAKVKALLQDTATNGEITLACTASACNRSPNKMLYAGCA